MSIFTQEVEQSEQHQCCWRTRDHSKDKCVGDVIKYWSLLCEDMSFSSSYSKPGVICLLANTMVQFSLSLRSLETVFWSLKRPAPLRTPASHQHTNQEAALFGFRPPRQETQNEFLILGFGAQLKAAIANNWGFSLHVCFSTSQILKIIFVPNDLNPKYGLFIIFIFHELFENFPYA